jgi:hypothetical protein
VGDGNRLKASAAWRATSPTTTKANHLAERVNAGPCNKVVTVWPVQPGP